MTKKCLFLCLLFSSVPLAHLTAQWVETNRPQGGYIACLAACADSTGGTKIFAGTGGPANDGNGIFRSTNNGRNWTAVNHGLPAGALVTSLAAHGSSVFATLNGGGVYRTMNYGESWTAVNNGLPNPSYPFALASYGDNIFVGNIYSGGVFRSANNGDNWTAVNNGLDSSTVYHGVNAIAVNGNSIFLGTQIDGIYRSNDNGASWTYCGFKDTTVMSLSVSGSKIIADLFGLGVYCSTNNGARWTRTSFPACNVLSFTVFGTNIMAGTRENGMYLSTDNGINWASVNTGLSAHYSFLSLATATDTKGSTSILAGNNRGIFVSTNNGQSWIEADSGLTGIKNSVLAAMTNTVDSTTLILGTASSGMFLSTNNGAQWNDANEGFRSCTIASVMAMAVSGTTVFAYIMDGNGTNLRYSTDNGKTWNQCISSPPYEGVYPTLAVGTEGGNKTTMFYGTMSGLYFSQDKGGSWTPVKNGFPGGMVQALAAYGDVHYPS